MGCKRPFDDEFLEFPFKHSKHIDFNNKLTQFAESVPCVNDPQKPDISGEDGSGLRNFEWQNALENDNASTLADKDYESSAPLSWVTSSSSDDDARSGAAAQSNFSREFWELDFPRRTFAPFDDVASSYLDHSPRRQVPLGPNHQASVPLWPSSFPLHSGSEHNVDTNNEVKLMGTCVIPMPDMELSSLTSDNAGVGRTDCGCLDEGSIRCVRRHVMEARERLKKSLGHEKFNYLGFNDMGEAVAHQWDEEEQQIFHKVVYSYPVSVGQNFWKHLSALFPYRSIMEIVSYYFNVFMLRRRCVQNRSKLLDIDSDDDEWQGNKKGSYAVHISEDDDDSAIESLVEQDDEADHGEDALEDDNSSDDDDDDNDDDCGGDGVVGDGSGDALEDCAIDYMPQAFDVKAFDNCSFDPLVKHMDNAQGSVGKDFHFQDDSCMSFEFRSNIVNSCNVADAGAAYKVSGVMSDGSKCLSSRLDGCCDVVGHVYLLEPCDAKVWDSRYSCLSKGVDLLPTSNIMDELFGQGAWDNKTRSDHGIN